MKASFFHSEILAGMISKSAYLKPVWLDENHHLLGIASGGLFSKRLIIYGNPYTTNEEIELFTSALKDYNYNSIYIEFRNLNHIDTLETKISQSAYKWQDWYNIEVTTNDSKTCWNKINSTKKRQIRRSIDHGAKIIDDITIEQLKEFYNILKKLYRKKIRKPLPDWNFFESFYHVTKNTSFGKYLLVEYQGKIISGMMCPITPKQDMFEWYVAGLDREFNNTDIYPSSLVTWAAIEFAAVNSIPKFNFMGAGQPNVDYGVRVFKLQFGGTLINTGRFIRINKPLLYKIGSIYINIIKHI